MDFSARCPGEMSRWSVAIVFMIYMSCEDMCVASKFIRLHFPCAGGSDFFLISLSCDDRRKIRFRNVLPHLCEHRFFCYYSVWGDVGCHSGRLLLRMTRDIVVSSITTTLIGVVCCFGDDSHRRDARHSHQCEDQ